MKQRKKHGRRVNTGDQREFRGSENERVPSSRPIFGDGSWFNDRNGLRVRHPQDRKSSEVERLQSQTSWPPRRFFRVSGPNRSSPRSPGDSRRRNCQRQRQKQNRDKSEKSTACVASGDVSSPKTACPRPGRAPRRPGDWASTDSRLLAVCHVLTDVVAEGVSRRTEVRT